MGRSRSYGLPRSRWRRPRDHAPIVLAGARFAELSAGRQSRDDPPAHHDSSSIAGDRGFSQKEVGHPGAAVRAPPLWRFHRSRLGRCPAVRPDTVVRHRSLGSAQTRSTRAACLRSPPSRVPRRTVALSPDSDARSVALRRRSNVGASEREGPRANRSATTCGAGLPWRPFGLRGCRRACWWSASDLPLRSFVARTRARDRVCRQEELSGLCPADRKRDRRFAHFRLA